MTRLLLQSTLLGMSSVAAFMTSSCDKRAPKAATTFVSESFEDEIGVTAPMGYFDPLGLLRNADAQRFNRLRYVELKHGRISMLAIVGHMVTTAGARLGGDIDLHGTSFASIPPGLAALSAIPKAGLAQIIAFIGFLELAVMKDVTLEGEFPGDFRNGAIDFGWDTFTVEEQERKRNIELNNGRAAMMGILALMVHEQLPSHDPYVINSLLGSPVPFNSI
ncbi:fucoxanthin chlorophyll a c protein [Mayamaea pseudoterrestris]|nr:fucoxanthin chlorophyll a c protein [Mayamaea pseudoterrestris]